MWGSERGDMRVGEGGGLVEKAEARIHSYRRQRCEQASWKSYAMPLWELAPSNTQV